MRRRKSTEILAVIRRLAAERGQSPTHEEIARELNLSPGSIPWHLKRLQAQGFIELMHNQPRTIRLITDETMVVRLGTIEDEAAVTDPSRIVTRTRPGLAHEFTPAASYFVLADDAMDRLVRVGDRVAILATDDRKKGEIILVRYAGQLALRKHRDRADGRIELVTQSRNPKHGGDKAQPGEHQGRRRDGRSHHDHTNP